MAECDGATTQLLEPTPPLSAMSVSGASPARAGMPFAMRASSVQARGIRGHVRAGGARRPGDLAVTATGASGASGAAMTGWSGS